MTCTLMQLSVVVVVVCVSYQADSGRAPRHCHPVRLNIRVSCLGRHQNLPCKADDGNVMTTRSFIRCCQSVLVATVRITRTRRSSGLRCRR